MKLTPSTAHRIVDARPVWLLALCALRLRLKVEKQAPLKATQEPLPLELTQ